MSEKTESALEEQVTRHTEYCGLKPDTISGHGICDCGADQAAAELAELKRKEVEFDAVYKLAEEINDKNVQLRATLESRLSKLEQRVKDLDKLAKTIDKNKDELRTALKEAGEAIDLRIDQIRITGFTPSKSILSLSKKIAHLLEDRRD